MSAINVLFLVCFPQVRISSWPKEIPGSWFSEFKRGKIVSLSVMHRMNCSNSLVFSTHSPVQRLWLRVASNSSPIHETVRQWNKCFLIMKSQTAEWIYHSCFRQSRNRKQKKEVQEICSYHEQDVLSVKIISISFEWKLHCQDITILRLFRTKNRASIKHYRRFRQIGSEFTMPVFPTLPFNS